MTDLRNNLLANIKASSLSKKYDPLLAVLNARPSRLRDRRMARMEAHARAHLGLDAAAAIDWSTIDWSTVFGDLLKLLLMLLPFILAA